MNTQTIESVLVEALVQLQADRCSLPWSERLEIAQLLADSLTADNVDEAELALVHLLACDPKWEVRCEIADLLLAVPDSDFSELAAQLSQDTNSYVQQAAQRALNRRRQIAKRNGRTRQTVDEITRQLESIEERHGKRTAQTTMRVCDRFVQVVVGGMVHDLRSILTHLGSNCDTLMEQVGRRKRESRKVQADLEVFERTLRDMELFTQPIPEDRHRERLADVVTAAIEMASNNVRRSGFGLDVVSLRVDVPESLTAEITRHRIVVSLANVIENAYEAFKVSDRKLRAGEIMVRGRQVDDQAEIRVADSGMGMTAEEFVGRSMFVPGRRNKSKKNSTGYGLANAARAVAAHGGSLALDSQEDEGTTVTMTLPMNRYNGETP